MPGATGSAGAKPNVMHNAYLDIISGRSRGLTAACVRGALALCAPAYGLGVQLRNRRLDRPTNTVAAGVPVISVGNLTTGGTGKTPVVAWIANRLRDTGRRPAILSRGYKSLDGAANDEKLLLDRLCPGVPHIQNPDRVAGAREAIDQHRCDVLVLDDGFQHRRLRRDSDIVLIDALNPWGYGHLLPRGLLREPRYALRRASLVLITRANLSTRQAIADLQRKIARSTSAPIITSEFRPSSLVDATGISTPLTALNNHTVLPFCGIGNPDGFRHTLRAIDPRLASLNLSAFPDHHHYAAADLTHLATQARNAGADLLLTTEKDLVKLPPAIGELPVRALRIGLHITSGAELLTQHIDAQHPLRAVA
jgi:tetraacyldisaccharide 4'-kinase